jgi:hypothetical protein
MSHARSLKTVQYLSVKCESRGEGRLIPLGDRVGGGASWIIELEVLLVTIWRNIQTPPPPLPQMPEPVFVNV